MFAFGYDPANRRTSVSYPNGTVAGYGYDAAGRLVSVTHKSQDGATIASASYTYDKVGNRLTKGGNVSESYRYDVIDQLLRSTAGAAIEIFSYDAVGNRLSGPSRSKDASYEHDAANRMLKGRQYLYSYDENGNQLSKALSSDSSKGWTYTWDYENRLVKAERTGGGGSRTVTFQYDPFGRRIEKLVTAVINGATKVITWHYVYDGSDIAIEVKDDGANTTATSYDHGPGTDDHLALQRDGRFYFYHADGLGSVVSITDNDRRIVQSYTYESFGLQKPSTGFENRYTYTGREWDREGGLYYYRTRYYDVMEGRFISEDTAGFAGGINQYSYVENNAINLVDPDGRMSLFVRPVWWNNFFKIFRSPPPPENWPKPPNWTPEWQWRYPECSTPKTQPRWFDPNGGEWRWHGPDKWHPNGHWDYNPWDKWNSPWRNKYPVGAPPTKTPYLYDSVV